MTNSDRESNIYKAKLAEQAERYDGQYNIIDTELFQLKIHQVLALSPGPLNREAS